MRRVQARSTQRYPWVAYAAWGWRLEIAVSALGLVSLLIASAVNRAAPLVVYAIAAFVLWKCPGLRGRCKARSADIRNVSHFERALWHCGIVGRQGDIPRVLKTAPMPVGMRYLVRLSFGLHFEYIESCAPQLATALGARTVQVKALPQCATYVEVAVIYRNAFPSLLNSPLLNQPTMSLWQPIILGMAQTGDSVRLTLPEHNMLIGGEPGAGKSVALSTIIAAAALDPGVTITLLDGKQVELAAWSAVAHTFVGPNQDDAIGALESVRREMDQRYEALLAARRRKLEPSDNTSLHVVVVDELAFYLRGGSKVQRDLFSELLRDLVSRGRAAGIIVVAATQKPSHDVVPTFIRDLFAFRLAMRCTSNDASDTILGQGWAAEGYSAAAIEPRDRGVGYLLAEGAVPVLIKTPYLSDAEIDILAARAESLRGVM